MSYPVIRVHLDWGEAKNALEQKGTVQRAEWGDQYALRLHYDRGGITIFNLDNPAEHCPYEISLTDAQATDWQVINYPLAIRQ